MSDPLNIDAIYDQIKAVLEGHRMSFTYEDEDSTLPLLDMLCAPGAKDVGTGKEEIIAICDAIYSEVLQPLATLSHPATQAGALQAAEKTDREWMEFCRPYVFMNGSHEMPNYAAICRAVLALAATQPSAAPGDGHVWLKCDGCGKDMRSHDRMGHCAAPGDGQRGGKVLAEHSGCGGNPQWEQVSVRLNPGDKVVLFNGVAPGAKPAAGDLTDEQVSIALKHCSPDGDWTFSDAGLASLLATFAAPSTATAAREQEAGTKRITEAEAGTALIRAMDDLGLNKSLRAEIVAAYARHIASRPEAPAAPSAEEPSEKQKKLYDLADRIDHEQLWRVAGIDHSKFTPEQKDRLNAGVALRRYGQLLVPGRWLVFPPEGNVHFSASTLDAVYKMAKNKY